ncbi:SAYSvFN domain-containing protein 1-like [Scleropages formosus]|uniref:SAYSVFN motif domain containing 1 n=1 Tax=Scleropages formosus TaxID=113540 RepID=A0A0P7UTS0_SCLFO|nr:SAYSvFN domain-containing protein 1 [Scleropages formosus]KPP73243.1 SAYSvFN domain-containing protein 1-like [Scleropages formosus]
MEQKLLEFRARKKAEAASKCIKPQHKPRPDPEPQRSSEPERELKLENDRTAAGPSSDAETTNYIQTVFHWLSNSTVGRRLGLCHLAVTNLTFLKLLLWLVLLGLFTELDFGLPFFLISLFYWLYEGLRSPTVRQPGELSAYSVFNPDCQPILGTLTAEQLEGEMGYRTLPSR